MLCLIPAQLFGVPLLISEKRDVEIRAAKWENAISPFRSPVRAAREHAD